MADDALRMQAEVVDKFSGPLKSLQTQLRGINGGLGVKQLKKDLEDVQGHMAKTATVAKDLLNPALAGFGIAALSAGGALIGIGSAIRGFSADTTNLSSLSREVGIGATKLRELQSVAGRFNLDPSQIARSTRYFADQIDQMHRNRGEAYNFLLQQSSKDPTGNVARWTQSIKTARSNAEAYQKTLDFIASIKDPLQRGDVAEKLLGDRSLGALGSEGLSGLHKQQEQAQKDLGSFGKAAEDAAIAFERSIQSLRDQLRGLRDDLGPDLLQPLNAGLSELGGWLREHKGDIREGIVDGLAAAKLAIQEFPWAEAKAGAAAFFGDIKTLGQETATAIRAVGDALGVVKDLMHGNVGEALKKLGKIDGETDLGLGKDRPAGRIQDGMRGDLAPLMLRQEEMQKRLAILDENIARKESQPDPLGDGHVQATEERQRRDKLSDEIKKLTEEIRRKREQDDKAKGDPKADPASFDAGGGFGGGARIVKASLGGGGFGDGGAAGFGGGLRQRGGGLDVPDNGERLRGQGPVSRDQSEREQRAMARLVAHGWTPEAAASAIGQAVTESGVRSDGPLGDTKRFGFGDDAAHGMFQWRAERFRALKRFAEARKKPWTDFDTQVDFFDAETKRRSRAEANWRNERDIGRGNRIGQQFEGYSGPLQGQRERDGRRIHEAWRRGSRPVIAREDGATQPDTRRKLQDARADDGKGASFPNGAPRVLKPRSMADDPSVPGTVLDRGMPAIDQRRRLQDARKLDADTGDGIKQVRPWTKAEPKPADRRADLMGRARAAAQASASAKAEGQVHVNVNAPPGWRASTTSRGELFREVRLNRGNAMQLASQEA